MASEIIFMVDEAPEGGYTSHALGYSIYTEADNEEELKENVQDVVRCHFEADNSPSIIRLHLVKEEVVKV